MKQNKKILQGNIFLKEDLIIDKKLKFLREQFSLLARTQV